MLFTVAEMSAFSSYVSLPAPAAKPKTTRLLLTTARHAVVFTVALLMLSVLFPDVPCMEMVGRSRFKYVTDTPGTTIDS